jgi:hypothetical protein
VSATWNINGKLALILILNPLRIMLESMQQLTKKEMDLLNSMSLPKKEIKFFMLKKISLFTNLSIYSFQQLLANKPEEKLQLIYFYLPTQGILWRKILRSTRYHYVKIVLCKSDKIT